MISYPKTNRDADGVKARECQPTVLTRKFEFAAARLRSWPTTAILTHQHDRDLHPDVLIQALPHPPDRRPSPARRHAAMAFHGYPVPRVPGQLCGLRSSLFAGNHLTSFSPPFKIHSAHGCA